MPNPTTPYVQEIPLAIANGGTGATTDVSGNDIIQVQQATGTSDINQSSTSFGDMTDMSLSVVVATGDVVIIDFGCVVDYGGTNAGSPVFQLLRDSTVLQTAQAYTGAAGREVGVKFQYVDTPSAATYTYKIQWKSIGGGPEVNNCATEYHYRNLRAIKILARTVI